MLPQSKKAGATVAEELLGEVDMEMAGAEAPKEASQDSGADPDKTTAIKP